jgi:cyclopropane fatty-acyl-phospholipid synthase-like methyltransferase
MIFGLLTSYTAEASSQHARMPSGARIQAGTYVLDLGCGLGGASRYLAAECGCQVAAIDLTPNFVEVACILSSRCGLADRVEIRQANALALPFQEGTFDHGHTLSP